MTVIGSVVMVHSLIYNAEQCKAMCGCFILQGLFASAGMQHGLISLSGIRACRFAGTLCAQRGCSMQVAIRTRYFTWINVAMIGLSIGCWLPALYGFSSIGPLQRTLTDMVELGPHLFKQPAFWLGVVICAPVMA